ncbi:MAG: creatininase family protein [Candidatus Krumholzibacteria bacterium]
MEITPGEFDLAKLTTDEFAKLLGGPRPVVVMIPVGSVEPHGPHLSLVTDTVISHSAALRAARILKDGGLVALVAPVVPYGVTECAAAFRGAISVSPQALTGFLRDLVEAFLADEVAHVCLVNNHLEPDHDAAVRAAIDGITDGRASVASPLARRWARTLSREFKSGACHAGRYETSIILAATPELVNDEVRKELAEVPISLSDKLKSGVTDFAKMGLSRAYSGSPADASTAHGDEQLARLATMVATEIREGLARLAGQS